MADVGIALRAAHGAALHYTPAALDAAEAACYGFVFDAAEAA